MIVPISALTCLCYQILLLVILNAIFGNPLAYHAKNLCLNHSPQNVNRLITVDVINKKYCLVVIINLCSVMLRFCLLDKLNFQTFFQRSTFDAIFDKNYGKYCLIVSFLVRLLFLPVCIGNILARRQATLV